MDSLLESYLEQLVAACPALTSIWLIGSRANGTATEISDWDFIAFGSEAAYSCLQASQHLHRDKTDFLVVTNGNDFRNAWGEKDKGGSLSEWEWQSISDYLCEYTETKWEENDEQSRLLVTRKKAIRVWPRN